MLPPAFPQLLFEGDHAIVGLLQFYKIKTKIKNFEDQAASCFFPAMFETDPRPYSSEVSRNLTGIWGAQRKKSQALHLSLAEAGVRQSLKAGVAW